jgi:hypothetical protein
LARDRK